MKNIDIIRNEKILSNSWKLNPDLELNPNMAKLNISLKLIKPNIDSSYTDNYNLSLMVDDTLIGTISFIQTVGKKTTLFSVDTSILYDVLQAMDYKINGPKHMVNKIFKLLEKRHETAMSSFVITDKL